MSDLSETDKEEVVKKPKLFFVGTSATTTTLETASISFIPVAAYATDTLLRRKQNFSRNKMK